MLQGKFVHLHVHSEFSLLDGANRIKDLPVRAKELGMNAMAITDHGAMFGAIDFYKACKANDIKPIIGCEVYVAPRNRKDKDPNLDARYSHLILLAKDNQGYKNLATLVSLGYTEGFYYKPRIDHEIIEKYHEGIICLSACLAGEVNQAILANDMEKAKEVALWYKSIFGEDYYLEIQNNGIKEQVLANQKLIQLARELDIPLVATNDAHYLKREDAYNHEVLLCIQTGKRMTDEDRMKFDTDELYVKSPEEMSDYFKNVPDAIENTVKIAEKCNVEFEFGHTILPNYDVPQEFATHYDYLEKLTYDGLKNRYGENPSKEILERTEYELSVIKKMGYVDYFLIVWDYIHYAKTHNIPVGPGRGSGAGSIVAYSIEITDIDPIQYNLIFERFLNPERISMPDFDVDFCYEKRDKVIEYVEQKYGKDHVSQIITFGTMSARMVIRDVARVLDMPYAEADKLAKMIPNEIHITIKKAMEQNKELKELYDTDEEIKKMLNIAMALEGMPRQASTHACGIVITKEPVVSYVPLYVRDGAISTQYIMTTLEELGLLKMDFLALEKLNIISKVSKKIKNFNINNIPLDDKKTLKIFYDADTDDIFQFESSYAKSVLDKLKITSFNELTVSLALVRPGANKQIDEYLKNKKEGINLTGDLADILGATYGTIIYQEQVMKIFEKVGGYSLFEADDIRVAISKKKEDIINAQHDKFVSGGIKNGYSKEFVEKLFNKIKEFGGYGFNKSHSVAYALVSYQMAYLKANYPKEFMFYLLENNKDISKCEKILSSLKNSGYKLLKPNINYSIDKYAEKNGYILLPLNIIRGLNDDIISKIIRVRENGFNDIFDFFVKTNSFLNNETYLILIKSGALDIFKINKQTMIKNIDVILNYASIYSDGLGKPILIKYPEYDEATLREFEVLSYGMYITNHPCSKYKDVIKVENIKNYLFKNINMVLLIKNIRTIKDKKGGEMAFLECEDETGKVNLTMFSSLYAKNNDLKVNELIRVNVKVSKRFDKLNVLVNNIKRK